MTEALAADGIVVEVAGRIVIDAVSIKLRPGTCTVIVGPNGAGKSTLVAALAGLIPVRAGVVRRATAIKPPCVVFERNGMISGLTVAENIVLPLVQQRRRRSEIADRLDWALARFDLGRWEHADTAGLSPGVAVRVQLARAALMEPEVLLCDAAIGQLDDEAAEEIARLLARSRHSGTALLVTTNVARRTAALADATLRLEQGRLWLEGEG